ALALAREAPPRLVRGDGPSLAAELTLNGSAGVHPVVWHSLALVYTYESQQRELAASLDRAGADSDLTWIYLEGPGGRSGLPQPDIHERPDAADCALVAVTYRGARRSVQQLAAVDPHVATMQWLA
ncbi:MAG: DUF2332 family protein, partial [Solirubrobacteraceae bacterium]